MDHRSETVEAQISEWRAYVHQRSALSPADADELEDHLRGRMADLIKAGLDPDEAFLVAVKRVGSLDALTREFAREHSDRLWKQLVLANHEAAATGRVRGDLVAMVCCAAVAALAVKVPAAFGLSLADDAGFYARNLGLFALVPLTAYYAWRRTVGSTVIATLVLLVALGVAAANLYPLSDDGSATLLTSLHLPMALWLTAGLAYVTGEWRSDPRRMDFVRFTGEWFIYYVLIALGGGVLSLLIVGTFEVIGVDVQGFVRSWLLPCGAMGAVVVSAWLVEAKQSVVENMAPVLSRVFTPLFAVALLAFLGGVIATRTWVGDDRDVLILFDGVLAVVLGLVLYAVSAREPAAGPGWFDRLQIVLVVAALLIDVLVLAGVSGRITDHGFTANRTAALGENLILLTNLAWSAWLLLRFVQGRAAFARMERWQTGFLTVYAAWAWVVVLVFPLVFGFS